MPGLSARSLAAVRCCQQVSLDMLLETDSPDFQLCHHQRAAKAARTSSLKKCSGPIPCLHDSRLQRSLVQGRLLKALLRAFGRIFVITGIIRIVDIALQLLAPFLLEKLLLCIEQDCSKRESLFTCAYISRPFTPQGHLQARR